MSRSFYSLCVNLFAYRSSSRISLEPLKIPRENYRTLFRLITVYMYLLYSWTYRY